MTCCDECGYDWASAPNLAIATITTLPADISRLLIDLDIDDGSRELRARADPRLWSPLEYIAHVGDAIDWYASRVNRVLTEDRPALEPADWDAHTAGQQYHERRLDHVLNDVESACARFTAVLAGLTAADWQREGTGSDSQPRTITELARRAAHEARHHVQDIRAGLTRTGSGQSPDGR